jgi:hypothetical protein
MFLMSGNLTRGESDSISSTALVLTLSSNVPTTSAGKEASDATVDNVNVPCQNKRERHQRRKRNFVLESGHEKDAPRRAEVLHSLLSSLEGSGQVLRSPSSAMGALNAWGLGTCKQKTSHSYATQRDQRMAAARISSACTNAASWGDSRGADRDFEGCLELHLFHSHLHLPLHALLLVSAHSLSHCVPNRRRHR